MAVEELSDAWWDRVYFLRNREDQRCEHCKEWPDVKKGFHVRVTLKNPLGSKSDPSNLGLYCYGCRPTSGTVVAPAHPARRQLHLF